ncbi:hypothetical protein [Streptomyces sp. NPDC002133]|uniref:hypothetical protein n=1 Tax=Streptomyces sp. NPDC002133 TaxID=3154409 RepID=UPI003332F9F3
MMQEDPAAGGRREEQSRRLDAFLQRAAEEGHLRPDVSLAWVRAILDQLGDSAAHRSPEVEPPQAADLVVDTFLNGVGRS